MSIIRYTMEFRSHQCGQCKHETGISIAPVPDALGQWVRYSDVEILRAYCRPCDLEAADNDPRITPTSAAEPT